MLFWAEECILFERKYATRMLFAFDTGFLSQLLYIFIHTDDGFFFFENKSFDHSLIIQTVHEAITNINQQTPLKD